MKRLFLQTIFLAFSALLVFKGSSFLFAENLVIFRLLGTHLRLGTEKAGSPSAFSSSSPSSSLSSRHSELAKNPLSSSNILLLQQALQQQITYNLIEQLDIASNGSARSRLLENYLSSSNQLLYTAQSFLDQERITLETHTNAIRNCETPIRRMNADFTAAVQSYDFRSARSLAQQIASQRACIAENTVYYTEHLLYRDTTLSLQTTLQKRVEYLTLHKENIIAYYDVLKPQLLKELYDISQTLEVNFNG